MTDAPATIDPGKPATETRRFCTFVVAGRAFAVDASAVQEVFRGTVTTPVPRGPAAIRGLLNLRGRIVPAIDMRRRMGFEPISGEGIHVVLTAGGETHSLIVDALTDVVDIPVTAIETAPEAAAAGSAAVDPLWMRAQVDFGGVRQWVSLACLPEAKVGDRVLVHVGLALSLVQVEP